MSGCTCNATHVNGLVKEVRNSQTDAHVLPVTESPDCVIRIVLMPVRLGVARVGGRGGEGRSTHDPTLMGEAQVGGKCERLSWGAHLYIPVLVLAQISDIIAALRTRMTPAWGASSR